LAGAGCAAAVGISYLTKEHWYPLIRGPLVESPAPTITTPENNPPYANFEWERPICLNPSVGQKVSFSNLSRDPDNDALSYDWYIDGKLEGHSEGFSVRFKEAGQHIVRLEVSDGKLRSEKEITIYGIEPDQIYPTKSLHVKYKGINYSAANLAPGWAIPTPSKEEMDEQLDTIRDDLGCNSIIISAGGNYEDCLIECGKLAIEKGFERIYISPRYIDATPDETVERIEKFASKAKSLREQSENIVFMVGHEFGIDTIGITPGNNWIERATYQTTHNDWLDRVRTKVPVMFSRIIPICRRNYGYEIAYAAAVWEIDSVPWSDPMFESVCTNAYIMDRFGWTENWVIQHLSSLRRYGKPIISSEWGCMTFSGAGRVSAAGPLFFAENPYDEDGQANYIKRYCNMLNLEKIDGCFYTQYNETWDKGYGLYHPVTRKRKKGFYMYKSYERVGS